MKTFVSALMSSGWVNQIKFDVKNTFVITQKGRMFLEQYQKFHDFAGSFGLDM